MLARGSARHVLAKLDIGNVDTLTQASAQRL